MKFSNKLLLTSAACTICALPVIAEAETVTTTQIVQQKELPNMEKTNFSAFDLNKDGTLSMQEVGEKLFYVFDTDGNEVIDNIEFDNKKVMTIIPMEKNTYTFIDWDNDGNTDQATYTYDTFIQKSHLMRFDEDMDGLSPADFIEMTFLELDDNKDKVIDLEEWKEEYFAKTRPATAEQERYN